MKPIMFSAIIDGVSTKKDRTLSIKLGTQELDADETSKIFALQGLQIYVVMSEEPIA